jgi:hypothetical protein
MEYMLRLGWRNRREPADPISWDDLLLLLGAFCYCNIPNVRHFVSTSSNIDLEKNANETPVALLVCHRERLNRVVTA